MAQITFDSDNLTEKDLEIISILSGGTPTAAPKAAGKPAAKTAATKADPEPEGSTLQEAIDKATKMVSDGQAALVKAALKSVSAAKVSELTEDQVPSFLEALDV